jgi:hypothetical protein
MPALPRAVLWWLAVLPSFHSWEEVAGTEETLCQNSDVAIFCFADLKKIAPVNSRNGFASASGKQTDKELQLKTQGNRIQI